MKYPDPWKLKKNNRAHHKSIQSYTVQEKTSYLWLSWNYTLDSQPWGSQQKQCLRILLGISAVAAEQYKIQRVGSWHCSRSTCNQKKGRERNQQRKTSSIQSPMHKVLQLSHPHFFAGQLLQRKKEPSKTLWNLLGYIPSMIRNRRSSQRENTPCPSISHLIWLLLSSNHHSCSNCCNCNPQPWKSTIILLGCTFFFLKQFAPRYPLAFLEIASEFRSMKLTSSVCAWRVQQKAPKDLKSSKCLVFVPQSLNSRIRNRFNHVSNLSRFLFTPCNTCVLMTHHPSSNGRESIQMSWSMSSAENTWLLSIFSIGEMFSFPLSPAFAMARCCHCLPCYQGLHLCATPPVVYLGTNQMGVATFTFTTRLLNIWLYILTTRGCGYLYYTQMLTCWYSKSLVVRTVKPDGISYMCRNDKRCHLQVLIWICKCFEVSIHFVACC